MGHERRKDADTICPPGEELTKDECHEFWDWWKDYKMSKHTGYGPSTYTSTYSAQTVKDTYNDNANLPQGCSFRCMDAGCTSGGVAFFETRDSNNPLVSTYSIGNHRTRSSTPRAASARAGPTKTASTTC